jgi:small subunit ribosomal protein SAe
MCDFKGALDWAADPTPGGATDWSAEPTGAAGGWGADAAAGGGGTSGWD